MARHRDGCLLPFSGAKLNAAEEPMFGQRRLRGATALRTELLGHVPVDIQQLKKRVGQLGVKSLRVRWGRQVSEF